MNDVKYIKVGESDKFIPVYNIYPFIHDAGVGKQVLRMYFDPKDISYNELFDLFSANKAVISEYWEETIETPGLTVDEPTTTTVEKVLKTEHTNYFNDYACSFNTDSDYPGMFFVEITRATELALQSAKNTENITNINLALCDVYELALGLSM